MLSEHRYDDDEPLEVPPSLSGAAEAARRRRGEDRLYDDPPYEERTRGGRSDYGGSYGPPRGGHEERRGYRDDRARDENGYDDGRGHRDDRLYDDSGYGDDGDGYGAPAPPQHPAHDGVGETRPPRRQRRPQERVIYKGNPHWTGLLGFYFKGIGLVTVAGVLCLGLSKAGMFGLAWPILLFIVGYAAVYGIGRLLISSTQYSVSTRRIIKRWGIVHKHQEEASIQRIQNITVNVSLLDRLLRIGAIDFDTAAVEDTNQLRFWGVKRPFDIHGRLMADEEFNEQLY